TLKVLQTLVAQARTHVVGLGHFAEVGRLRRDLPRDRIAPHRHPFDDASASAVSTRVLAEILQPVTYARRSGETRSRVPDPPRLDRRSDSRTTDRHSPAEDRLPIAPHRDAKQFPSWSHHHISPFPTIGSDRRAGAPFAKRASP